MEVMKLEEKVFQLGSWSSLDELEESLTMTELHRLFMTQQEKDYESKRFAASLKGVSMDPWEDPSDKYEEQAKPASFEEIKARAMKRAAIENGELPADTQLDEAPYEGFGFESEDE
jgi:hypothetical protein